MTDRDSIVNIATALARAEGLEPHQLDYQIHEYVDTDALAALLAMDNSDWRFTVTIADHEVTLDGSGQIRVDGDLQHVVEM
jgi:hypothetical protein